MKRLALINDGSQALKDEIQESYLRVKAARHGMKLRDLVPNHGMRFYLPNKISYVKPKEYQKVNTTLTSMSPNSSMLKHSKTTKNRDRLENPSNTFLTSLNQSQAFDTSNNKLNTGPKSIERSFNQKINNSFNLFVPGRGRGKESLNNTQNMHESSKNKSLSTSKFKTRIMTKTGANIPSRLNFVSYRFNREHNTPLVEQRRKIRLVSLIDSRPINHYITLLSLKEFSKREQEMSGVAGSMQASSGGIKGMKNQDIAKILREQLTERYDEAIGK